MSGDGKLQGDGGKDDRVQVACEGELQALEGSLDVMLFEPEAAQRCAQVLQAETTRNDASSCSPRLPCAGGLGRQAFFSLSSAGSLP